MQGTSFGRILRNQDIVLKGPVIFDRGRYALISSILTDSGSKSREIIASGEAPVLENSKIALSFDVDPVSSKLLLESFKMATPDVSLVFEMTFSGLSDNYDAVLDVDWEKIKNSKTFNTGTNFLFVRTEIEKGFDELIQNQAIRLTSMGSNTSMEGLLNTVYSKLLELLFQPIEAPVVPSAEKGGIINALSGVLDTKGGPNKKSPGLGIGISYSMKQLKSTGTTKLTFNGRSTVDRSHYITFNIGDLYRKYGSDERFFRDVPLWDPAFQQMRIFVGVDGSLEREFDQMVNNVTVTLRKIHGDGFVTTKQVMVNHNVFLDSLGGLSMTYLNHKDTDLVKWMKYDYSTQWQFKGGGRYTEGWINNSTSMINLYVPFRRQSIALEGDVNVLKENQIRAVIIKIAYPFFGETKKEQLIVHPEDDISRMGFEITLPDNINEVDYTITWIKTDGSRKETSGKDSYGIIFIDELPDN